VFARGSALKTVISPRELARAIGSSESSVKRWVDSGAIRAARTAGGHRRIRIVDAVQFIREHRHPIVHAELLGLADLEGPVSENGHRLDRSGEHLYAFLEQGRDRAARGLVLSLFLSGMGLASIIDDSLREAMARLGELWRHSDEGIFREHRATNICIQAINQIALLVEAPPEAPVAVGGTLTGDPYLLPSMAAATVLSGEGFRAVNLGPQTPEIALMKAAERHEARMVWLSISSVDEAAEVTRTVQRLAAHFSANQARFIVGGRELERLNLASGGHMYFGASMAELAAFARGLRLASA